MEGVYSISPSVLFSWCRWCIASSVTVATRHGVPHLNVHRDTNNSLLNIFLKLIYERVVVFVIGVASRRPLVYIPRIDYESTNFTIHLELVSSCVPLQDGTHRTKSLEIPKKLAVLTHFCFEND